MATHEQKLACAADAQDMLRDNGLPGPDSVEFGETCIWLLFNESKTAVRIDIDEEPEMIEEVMRVRETRR